MNKAVFQIGLLAFFVSVVLFASGGSSIIDIISRSFMIFIGVVVVLTVGLLIGAAFFGGGTRRGFGQMEDRKSTKRDYASTGRGIPNTPELKKS